MEQHLNPYRDEYDVNVRKYYFQPKPPLAGDFDETIKLSKNLYLHEVARKSFVLPSEKNLFTYIPIDTRIPKAFQILRNALGKPINVTSGFRSVAWDLSKKRSGNSQHTHGKAIDLTGDGLVELVEEAVRTENELYKKLIAAGVGGIGIYKKKNFVHIDVRSNKWTDLALWTGDDDNSEKKNESLSVKVIGAVVGIILIVVGGIKYFLKR